MAVFSTLAIGAAAAATLGVQQHQAHKQRVDSKKLIEAAQAENRAAIQSVKDAQTTSSTNAAESIRKRVGSMSQTIYTSPLGIGGQASVARKTLLGQ